MKNSRKKKPRQNKHIKAQKNSGDVFAAVKAADAKLTQAAMQLEYSFDRGVNFKDRSITIVGPIEEPWFDVVDAAMSEFERSSKKKTVTVKVYSEGGSVAEAMAIVGRLRRSGCHIVTEGYGIIMSAATIILACGHRRKMSTYAQFMHHESSYEVSGRHSEIIAYVKQAEKEERQWAQCMARFSNKTEKFWYDWGIAIDKFLTVEGCIKYGVVDEALDDA